MNGIAVSEKELTARVLVESLRSTTCPACGGVKRTRQTLCSGDYYRLPAPNRKALYFGLGHGYEAAVKDAMDFLGVSRFVTPAARDA